MEIPLPHLYPPQQLSDGSIYHTQSQAHAPNLVSQLDLDPADPFQFNTHLDNPLGAQPSLHALQPRHGFDQRPLPRFHEIQSLVSSNAHDNDAYLRGAPYSVLSPLQQLSSQPQPHPETIVRPPNEIETRLAPVENAEGTDGHFSNLKMIPNPPELELWRNKLFGVDELITLTEDQYDRFTCFDDELCGLNGRRCAGLRRTSPTWTISTLTVQHNNINASPSCLITGTAD